MRERIRSLCALAMGIMMRRRTAEAADDTPPTLRDLVARGDRIVRGKVIAADEGTVAGGGGNLPSSPTASVWMKR